MWRRFAPCHFVFFVFLAMLVLSGCAGKTVLIPPEPATSEGTPPASEPAQPEPAQPKQAQPEQAPSEQTPPEQAPPEQTPPEQARPEQARPEPPPAADEGKPGHPEVPLPPIQPKLGPAASLYHQGEQHLKEGRLDQAEMTLERALRIEPRNPYYWHAMAEIRLGQGKKREAIQCCLKSNSLASVSSALFHRNNALIKRAQANSP